MKKYVFKKYSFLLELRMEFISQCCTRERQIILNIHRKDSDSKFWHSRTFHLEDITGRTEQIRGGLINIDLLPKAVYYS